MPWKCPSTGFAEGKSSWSRPLELCDKRTGSNLHLPKGIETQRDTKCFKILWGTVEAGPSQQVQVGMLVVWNAAPSQPGLDWSCTVPEQKRMDLILSFINIQRLYWYIWTYWCYSAVRLQCEKYDAPWCPLSAGSSHMWQEVTRRPGTQLGPFGENSDESQQPWLAKLRCQEHVRIWREETGCKMSKMSHTNSGKKTTTLCQPDARGAAAFAAGVVVALVAAVPVPSETLTLWSVRCPPIRSIRPLFFGLNCSMMFVLWPQINQNNLALKEDKEGLPRDCS